MENIIALFTLSIVSLSPFITAKIKNNDILLSQIYQNIHESSDVAEKPVFQQKDVTPTPKPLGGNSKVEVLNLASGKVIEVSEKEAENSSVLKNCSSPDDDCKSIQTPTPTFKPKPTETASPTPTIKIPTVTENPKPTIIIEPSIPPTPDNPPISHCGCTPDPNGKVRCIDKICAF